MAEPSSPRRERGAAEATTPRTQRVGAYALCARDDRLLVVRASDRTEVPGWWFLPGGGVEFGEHPAVAVLRELAEETGLIGADPRLLGVLTDVRERKSGGEIFTVRLIYAIDRLAGELVHEQGGTSDEARWVRRGDLDGYDVAPYVRRALADLYDAK